MVRASLPTFAVVLFFALEQASWAADPFPRGPGLYFSPVKLALLLAVYLGWVKLCNWVDHDAQKQSLIAMNWNPLMVGAGLLGLAAIWQLPSFFLSLFVFLILTASASFCYVAFRDKKVGEEDRLLTGDHLLFLAGKYLKLSFGQKEKARQAKRVPVRFMARGSASKLGDMGRASRVQESKGYKGAQEMVYEALQRRATDIHLEPTKEEMAVRFRIDGIMTTMTPFSRTMGDAVVNIFKVMCNMDITEKRKPQDGSFSAQVEDDAVDFRVATAGSVAGEKMVVRILDRSKQVIDLTQLGMRDKFREQIRALVTQPHGLFIVCGPTGAGKSTTLYACLSEIDRYQSNIITVENPVEYQLENITQIEINTKAGKTFAGELRSILRQDPDVIMIGEIRDQETAEIACQAAQTGHMVFTTLHANDTTTAVGRLIDLGVQPFLIGSALSGILGQRLVRMLCPQCKVRYKPNPDLLRKANLPPDKIKYFYKPPDPADEAADASDDSLDKKGPCSTCGGTGYFKRTGIFEFLVITERMREMIRENPNLTTLKQEAVKNGMRYLFDDGLRQVIEGKTSIQELLRVCK